MYPSLGTPVLRYVLMVLLSCFCFYEVIVTVCYFMAVARHAARNFNKGVGRTTTESQQLNI